MESENGRMSVLMLPNLAYGHICPFLELAKQLARRSFDIYLCSTPINLASIKNRVHENDNIQLLDFHLPSSPGLPPRYHSTNGLPYNLIPVLEEAFENAAPIFVNMLKEIKPDLVIYDFKPSWPAEVSLSMNIPAVYFAVNAAAASCVVVHLYKNADEKFPFPDIAVFSADPPKFPESVLKTIREIVLCFDRSSNLVLIKSFTEVEENYLDFLSDLVHKTLIPVGPLVHYPTEYEDDDMKNIMTWLDKKEKSSVLFACFGSENYLSAEEVIEMSCALEITKCDFIWSVRSPQGEEKSSLQLPEGFVQRIGDSGLILEGWAPQTKILGHPSIGGFLSHCGWSSVNESIKHGVPLIAMPMRGDQHTNAKLAVEIGVSMAIARNNEGKFKREEIANVIRKILAEESGEGVRRKAKELKSKIEEKGEDDLDKAAEELAQVCSKKKQLY
ncbi:UDP-glucosyltransferase 29-like [Apium graveolens]|uniref:UDP-glucosyltransferase 29-like n=1 Tax=Apium graveolens TaxID=4045 RepID=UPI003D7A41EB